MAPPLPPPPLLCPRPKVPPVPPLPLPMPPGAPFWRPKRTCCCSCGRTGSRRERAFRHPKNFYCRTASSASRASRRTSCCCATGVTAATTRTASSRGWTRFRTGIGELDGRFVEDRGYNWFVLLLRYCFECKNKATGDRKCIVCGGLRPPPLGKMVYCELCPRAYHQDCYIPPMLKVS